MVCPNCESPMDIETCYNEHVCTCGECGYCEHR